MSFDWLEDSLIAMRPCKERNYLMSLNQRAKKEDKMKKKAVREENIKKGSKSFRICV